MIVLTGTPRIQVWMATEAKAFDVTACVQAAAAIVSDVTRLTAALTEAQFHTPPLTGGWSVAYCIEHLTLAGRAFLPKWDEALKHASASKSERDSTFPYGWRHRLLL